MTPHSFAPRAACLLALAVSVAACANERTSVTNPVGAPAYSILVARDGRNLPTGTAVYTTPTGEPVPTGQTPIDSSLVVTFTGLDSLTTGTYKVWLGQDDPDPAVLQASLVPATGRIDVIYTDSVLNAEGDVETRIDTTPTTGLATFQNGGPKVTVQFTPDPLPGGQNANAATIILLSVETDPAAAAPSEVIPLWIQFANQPGDPVDIEVPNDEGGTTVIGQIFTAVGLFGTFTFDEATRYVFPVAGRGRASFRGDVFVTADSSLARPPVGYFYQLYLLGRDPDTTFVFDDTLVIGDLRSSATNASLKDADVDASDPEVQTNPPTINAASVRIEADTIAALGGQERPYSSFTDFIVTLESKFGPDGLVAPTIILSASVPSVVREGTGSP